MGPGGEALLDVGRINQVGEHGWITISNAVQLDQADGRHTVSERLGRGRQQLLPRRWVAVGVVALCLAVVVSVALTGADPRSSVGEGRPDSRRPMGTAGPRVFYAEGDHLSSAGLDGRSHGPASTRLYSPQTADAAWMSPDRHWLLLADGELVDLSADRPVPPVQAVPPELVVGPGHDSLAGTSARLATSQPWADHSKRLIVAYGGRLSSVELATGASVPLGAGRLPAGDPLGNGAAYVVAGPPLPANLGQLFPGSLPVVRRIDHVTAGQPVRTLATGPELLTALGASPGATVVAGHLLYSADGSRLAVELALFDGSRRAGAVVVLDRRGGVLDVTATPFAAGRTWLAWSPTESRLAFGIPLPPRQIGPGEEFLEPQLWRPGSREAQPVVGAGAQAALPAVACLWSGDGASLLCGDDTRWPIVTVVGGQERVVTPVPGRPLAWVSTRGKHG